MSIPSSRPATRLAGLSESGLAAGSAPLGPRPLLLLLEVVVASAGPHSQHQPHPFAPAGPLCARHGCLVLKSTAASIAQPPDRRCFC